jgi:hypothetical protein
VSEAAVQLAAPRDAEDAGAARFDPLDQAANAAPAGAHGNVESSEAKDAAIDVLTRQESVQDKPLVQGVPPQTKGTST